MKLAVVHNVLNVRGGAERVMLVLARAFRADFFTLIYEPEKTFEEARGLRIVELTKGFRMPENRAFHPWIYPLFDLFGMMKFLTLDLQDYDLTITSGKLGLFARGKRTIHYSHTPTRVLYDLRPRILEYLERTHGLKARLLAAAWFEVWRRLDRWAAQRPDVMVANSKLVRERIKKYYGRDSVLIYPPVEIKKFREGEAEDYFLAVQRISPEKRIEVLLEVFRRLPQQKLVLVGDYVDEDYKFRISRMMEGLENVTWYRNVSDRELADLYSHCRAVLQTSENVDFGMVPVEAMASGKPVIAVDEGGFRETVVDGETGLLVGKPYVENFVKVLESFDSFKFSPTACRRRAENFSEERFIERMRALVKRVLENSFPGRDL